MDETIVALAARLAGLEETDTALLEPLCDAALQRWIDRLRQGVTEENCGQTLPCAAAFSAAAEAVAAAGGGSPRRTSNGFDYNRLAMLLAVLEKRGGLRVSACDAYLNIIGGLSLDEPAADLAAVVALASSYLDRPVPGDLVAIGEVGLTGELRMVNHLDQRISEVRRLGFHKCVIPARRGKALPSAPGLELLPVGNIGEAIRAALGPRG